jgi:hypothetical protein
MSVDGLGYLLVNVILLVDDFETANLSASQRFFGSETKKAEIC